MIMAKRKDEFQVPSDILEASRPKAKVQCRVTGLSPMKTIKDIKSYFDGVHIDA